MSDQILDNDIQSIESEPKIQWAGFWIRVGASLIDMLVYLPVLGLNMYNLYSLKSVPLQILITSILIAYKPLMEFRYGATLGKMGVGIKVVSEDFQAISFSQACIRYTPWLISQIISIYGTFLLFQHPDFFTTTNWIEVGQLQSELTLGWQTYTGSLITLVSCLLVAFTPAKQGGHDMLAKTYCIYKES